jgi:3-hydroxyisobutyrate dehydrogenase-like beta-hydroxyacid dehydrogenase
MKTIGVIGLGIMGQGMAGRLLTAGYSVVVWNRSEDKARGLIGRGAKWGGSPADVARETDVIFTMLSADRAVLDVLLGEEGVIAGARPGQIVVDSSTVSPDTSRKLHEAFAARGVEFLDAPVTGSAPHAQNGELGFMVGGKKEVFEACVEYFQVMGKNWVHLGPGGMGSTAKLASNTMVAIALLALAEGLTIVEASGLDAGDFLRVIAKGGANSRVVETKSPKILSGDWSTEFSVRLMNKDLKLALELAQGLGTATPALALARQVLQMAEGSGFGELDVASVYRLYRQWACSRD